MDVISTILQLLSFRLSRQEMLEFNRRHFAAALTGTWIVGMGRYWDDDKASLLQHLGLGSVIYVFVLAAFIWIIVKPFRVDEWNYFTVVTFIGLTSFPAILYAIPVEKFVSIGTANSINVWFLAIVAVWRLCLLHYFLKKLTRLSYGNIFTITLMPICLIISTLTALNLHRVVFNIMGGVRDPSPHESAYFVLMLLTGISALLTLPLIIAYITGIYYNRKNLPNKQQDEV